LSLGDKSRVHGPDRSGKLTFQGDRRAVPQLPRPPAGSAPHPCIRLALVKRAGLSVFQGCGRNGGSLIAPERELEPSRARTSAVSCRPARRGKLGVHYAVSRPGRNQVRSLANSWRGEA
jgi:hypothetical protein